jgi:hypothetical protein
MNANNMKIKLLKTTVWLSVTATLTCCVIPIMLISIGLGSTLAALFSTFPLLPKLSHYKDLLFIISAASIAISIYSHTNQNKCLEEVCEIRTKRLPTFIYAAVTTWTASAFTAYLLPILNQ